MSLATRNEMSERALPITASFRLSQFMGGTVIPVDNRVRLVLMNICKAIGHAPLLLGFEPRKMSLMEYLRLMGAVLKGWVP